MTADTTQASPNAAAIGDTKNAISALETQASLLNGALDVLVEDGYMSENRIKALARIGEAIDFLKEEVATSS